MSVTKQNFVIFGISALLVLLVCLLLILLFTPVPADPDMEVYATCFVGDDPMFTGPLKQEPLIDGNLVLLHPTETSAQFLLVNATCVFLRAEK
tara:strand:+ start:260 stop:538 length:279 start_codon:yes stop_codon:yes gene_type:complete